MFLFSKPKFTFKTSEDICRTHEKSNQAAASIQLEMEDDQESVAPIFQHRVNEKSFSKQNPTRLELPCKCCNRSYQSGRSFCPVWDKKCLACGIRNLFKNSIICKQSDESNNAASTDEDLGATHLGSVDNN